MEGWKDLIVSAVISVDEYSTSRSHETETCLHSSQYTCSKVHGWSVLDSSFVILSIRNLDTKQVEKRTGFNA